MADGWLITGSRGQLGRALARLCAAQRRGCEGRDLDTLDIRDRDAVARWIEAARPAAVINCAAFTAVDDCEGDEALARAVNGTAVGHLARACDRVGALLVQISTDYVFPGDHDRPYTEEDPTAPRSAYGRSKLLGEELARAVDRHLIIRTAWLYGPGGRNFVEAIRAQLAAGARRLRVVADQQGCPTSCDDLAPAIAELVDAGARGTVHAVNEGRTSWHGFAEEIVHRLGGDAEVVPVTTAEYPRPAERPRWSVLGTGRLQDLLGRTLPDWRDGLQRYLEETTCAH